MNSKQKILIIRLSSIGDVILTSPCVRAVRTAFPSAQIDFITSKPFAEILENNPRIDNILRYDKAWELKEIEAFKSELIEKQGKYDIILDLQNNLRSKILAGGLGKQILKYKKNRIKKLSLVYLKKDVSKSENIQIPLLYIKAADSIGVIDDGLGLEFWLRDDKVGEYSPKKTINRSAIYITIAPGSKHFTKRYPADKFIEAIDLINAKFSSEESKNKELIFQITGGKEDADLGEYIRENAKAKVENYCGKLSLTETAAIIDKSDLLITNDSMALHIACARKTPVIAIFGSTTLDFGFGPFRSTNIVLETKIKCRPCTHIGRNRCPNRHFDCMNKITPESVAVNALEIITNYELRITE